MDRLFELEAQILKDLPPISNWMVRCFDSLDSTMDSARELLRDLGPQSQGLVLTRTQTKGRGRQGRSWESPEGGFFGTFALSTKAPIESLPAFTLVVGLQLARFLENQIVGITLKWPNDILTSSRKKLAGILVEHVSISGQSWLLAGIGVNLIQAPRSLGTASSVLEAAGAKLTVTNVAQALCLTLPAALRQFEQSGFSGFREDWLRLSFKPGEKLTVHSGDGVISGEFSGVTPSGALLVSTAEGLAEIITGEINVTCN